MSKPKVLVKEREVRLARAFLHAIGGDEKNGYLLLAIIAWGRLMTKAKDPFWKSLAHLSPAVAGVRLAAKLRARMHKYPSQYKHLAAVLKRRGGNGDRQAEAATSFMLIIETSKWDKNHYGFREGKDGHWDYVYHYDSDIGVGGYQWVWTPAITPSDPMYTVWAKLTGGTIPNKWFTDPVKTTVTKTIPPRPSQPRSLQHVLPQPNYIQPYASQHFYEERPHVGDFVLDPE